MIKNIINGIPNGHLSVADRAIHYGDGVFETIAISQSRPLLFDEHYQRLAEGCQRLLFLPPDYQLLRLEADSLIQGVDRGVLKIIISRGSGGRGYQPIVRAGPSRSLFLYDYPSYPESNWLQGVKLTVCQTQLSRNPTLAGIKHLNRLEQVLARSEWQNGDIAEGLMLDEFGDVIECTMSNLFLVENNCIYTPILSHCGVRGIVRKKVMELAVECGLQCKEEIVSLNRLYSADEVFVTNSVIGLWPVQAVDAHIFRPGDVTRAIIDGISAVQSQIQVQRMGSM